MKTKRTAYITILCLAGMACHAGIPEAPIVLYGVVKQNLGSGVATRRIQGTVSVTVVPPAGDSITVSAELRNINQQFSYALQLPCESVVNPQMRVSEDALMLAPLALTYTCSGTDIDGASAQIIGSDTLPLSQNDRGSFQRLDLQVDLLPQDTDGDGMSDPWETAFFYGAADPGADADGDGASNLHEYLAGTDPWDPHSFLSSVEATQGAGGFTVRWGSEASRYYRIERSASLLTGFAPIATGIQGTPPVNEFLDSDVLENETAFYRIVVE